MQRWDDVEEFLISEAARDLAAGAIVRPCLVAFRDEDPLFVAFLREFEKGQYADPMIELLAIAGGLAANRLTISFSARAWSLDDPVVPVVPGVGDLRQRVVTIHAVDGSSGVVAATNVLLAYDVVDGEVVWGTRLEETGVEGWIPQVLSITVRERAAMAATDRDLRKQVRRCDRLGHLVALHPRVARRLRLDGASAPVI